MNKFSTEKYNSLFCRWIFNNFEVWETDCGKRFEITNGTPRENEMKYCPFCGNELKEEA
jgi:hypothetical protein